MTETEGVRYRGGPKGGEGLQHMFSVEERKSSARIWLLCKTAIIVSVILPLLLVAALLMFAESPVDPVAFTLPTPRLFEGPLEPNTRLAEAKKLFEGKIIGPESMAMYQGYLYTGTADGKILAIDNLKDPSFRTIATLGKPPCGREKDEPTCGRPLGMRFDKEGYLIVVDAYLGLFKVNVVTGDVFKLYSSTEAIEGKKPAFLNDLDIASDGTMYISDSSAKWSRRSNRYLIMEGLADGRLLKFSPKTQKMEVLADGLRFANGVQLSKQEDFVMVVETTQARILKYYLKGPKMGKLETFADNLPGFPDNIRPSHNGGYWVGMAAVRSPKFSFLDFLSERPGIRKLIVKVIPQEWITKLAPKYGLLIELNKDGEIIRSFHDPVAKTIPAVSEVEDHDGLLYLGSYNAPYLGKLDLRRG